MTTSPSRHDENYMRRCLQLALCGATRTRPNPMVGAVVVSSDRDGSRILGEGYHHCYGEAHAEVNAFAAVAPQDERLLPTSTLYVSMEPCAHWGKTPPCVDLIVGKRVRRVVVGCRDSFKEVDGRGIRRLREAGIEVAVGVLEEECRWLNRRFFTFHEQHRPYIILKWAQSADGYLDDHFRPTLLSNDETLRLSHRLRAEEDAIVVGHTTWKRDQPRLTVRHWWGRNPIRFVLGDDMTMDALLGECRAGQLQSLIVEGGATTHQAFLEAGLWDEIRVETAPITLLGGTRAATVPPQAVLKGQTVCGGHTIEVWTKA